MKRTIKLRNVCACAIPGALAALAQEVTRRRGRNHRPCPELVVLRTEEDMVPMAIHLPERMASFGLYSECPSPHNPRGKRPLGVTMQVCPHCPHLHPDGTDGGGEHMPGAKGCREQCHGCAHGCWAELTLYIKQTPEFPFPPDDVDWFLYHYFHMDDLAAAKIHADFDFLYDVANRFERAEGGIAAGDVLNLRGGAASSGADVTDAAPSPQPAVRRKPGAPQLRCNVWLFDQISVLPDPRQCSHLKPHWKELYMEQVGAEPDSWDKSFHAAARYCRILIARGHGGLPA